MLRAGGGRGGGVEGGLRLADSVNEGGDAALVLRPQVKKCVTRACETLRVARLLADLLTDRRTCSRLKAAQKTLKFCPEWRPARTMACPSCLQP